MGLGLFLLQWKQQDFMVETRRDAKKMPVFEVKLWANEKKTRPYFWLKESSNRVELT